MADGPLWLVVPEMRCHFVEREDSLTICGALADFVRHDENPPEIRYFCRAHRNRGDLPIIGEVVFRRITITLDAIFAGASSFDRQARREALARLELAIAAAGGLVNLHTITTAIGRGRLPASPARRIVVDGDR